MQTSIKLLFNIITTTIIAVLKNNIKEMLIEMIFQLGINKQKKFVKMIKHLKNNEPFMASLEMLNSLWYEQTPERVNVLIGVLLKK